MMDTPVQYLLKVRSLHTQKEYTFTYYTLAQFDAARQKVKDNQFMELVQE